MSGSLRHYRFFIVFLFSLVLLFLLHPAMNVMARSSGQEALNRGTVLYKAGDYKKALDAFKEATQKDPALMKAWENLGWAHYKTGSPNEAQKVWTMLLKVEPDNADVLNALGVLHLETEKWDQAIKWFSKALRVDAGRDSVRLKYGDAFEGAKKWDKAIKQYKQVLKKRPHDLQALYRLVRVYEHSGNISKGIESLKHYLTDIGSKDTQSKHKLARLYAKQGNGHYDKKRYQQAASSYQAALKWRPLYPQYLKNLGWSYWHLTKWQSCEKIWLRYASRYPQETEAHNLLTRLYLRLEKHDKALASVKRSLALNADQPDEQLNKARALFASQQYQEAKALSGRLSRRYPKHLAINTFWGELLMQYHDFKRGRKQWRKVLDLGSESPRAYYYWLKSQYELGSADAALGKAEAHLKKQGPDRYLLQFLRDDALARNDIQNAIHYATQMLGDPMIAKNPRSWLDLAEMHKEAFQYSQSRHVLKSGLSRHPGHVALQLKLADINRVQRNHILAQRMFTILYEQHPYNHHAFTGVYASLNGNRQFAKAMNHLEQNERSFFKDYDLMAAKTRLATLIHEKEISPANMSDQAVYVPMLLYHGLSKREPSRNLSVQSFNDQLQALSSAGYTTITVQELEKMIAGRLAFPPKPILITFDDARRDSFQLADQVLQRHGMKATMFVPTSKIVPDHPFFADWSKISHYRRTNRWDIQSHGHEAHEPIVVDVLGNQGFFLANYRWLSYEQRYETPEAFKKRLHNDYHLSVKTLTEKFPNDSIIGYAFPYSEAGQESGGNTHDAWKINEAYFDRYFRFGFIQDTSGYNRVVPGDSRPKFMRRVGVPHTWDGARLLRHLVSQHPVNQAKLEQAKPYRQQGSLAKSKALLYQLRDEEPLMADETRFHLATIAYQQGLYREAAKRLESGEQKKGRTGASARELYLEHKVQWWNRPRLGIKYRYFSDSDDRSNSYWSARLDYPLPSPVDVWVEPGTVEFNQDGEDSLEGYEVAVGFDWRAAERFLMSAAGRLRMMDDSDNSANGWLSMRYGTKNQYLKLRIGREDIDTLEARLADIQTDTIAAEYFGRFYNLWSVKLMGNHRNYTDDNRRNDFRLDWRYDLPKVPYWQVGADVGYSDTERDEDLYYSPQGLVAANINVYYQRVFDADWALNAKLGLGAGKETDDSAQLGGRFHVDLSKTWQYRWRGFVAFDHSQSPSYDSSTISAGITFRF